MGYVIEYNYDYQGSENYDYNYDYLKKSNRLQSIAITPALHVQDIAHFRIFPLTPC